MVRASYGEGVKKGDNEERKGEEGKGAYNWL